MCYGCYQEHGSPTIVNTKTVVAARLIAEVYAFSAAGGRCHVVIDDFNIDDRNIAFCKGLLKEPELWGENDRSTDTLQRIAESRCLMVLEDMTLAERASALAIHDGYFEVSEEERKKYDP